MRALTLSLILFFSGCCGLSEHDKALIATQIAVNEGHARDESLPTQAREIASDNLAAFRELEAGR